MEGLAWARTWWLKPHPLYGFPKVLSLSGGSQDSSPDLLPGAHRRLGGLCSFGQVTSLHLDRGASSRS